MRYLSLFSGMEAAGLAWKPLGWKCVGVAEIDPDACHVLAARFNASRPKYMPSPDAPGLCEDARDARRLAIAKVANLPEYGTPGTLPNLGDVSQATATDIAALGAIDVLIGGSPCQDLSVAGKRAGLAGARSSLFHEQLRIFDAARTFCGARWLIWENVPGAFSSNKGRDFAVVVGALAGCELDVPRDGWGNEGVAVGDNGLVEWAVLDSQWFGVAQRRRRVFAVLDTGDWANRPPVLLESESLRGDFAPRREAGEGVAGTLMARAGSGSGLGIRAECDGGAGLIPEIARCVTTGEGNRLDGETCTFVPEVAGCLNNSGGHAYPGTTLQDAMAGGFMIPEVAHTLRADGFDASEDGTGRGTPLVPCYAIQAGALRTNPNSGPDGVGVQENVAYTIEARAEVQCVAFNARQECVSSLDVAGTLDTCHPQAQAVAFAQNQRDEVRQMDVAGALAAEPGMKQQTYLRQGMAVRRLTPIECERLQGAPDNWTLVLNRKGKPMADGPRYKMCGNSFTSTVIRWIGERIEVAHCWAETLRRAA